MIQIGNVAKKDAAQSLPKLLLWKSMFCAEKNGSFLKAASAKISSGAHHGTSAAKEVKYPVQSTLQSSNS